MPTGFCTAALAWIGIKDNAARPMANIEELLIAISLAALYHGEASRPAAKRRQAGTRLSTSGNPAGRFIQAK